MEKKLKVKSYSWRPGSQHKIAADVAAEEIQRLASEHDQRLDAETVLAEAENPASPLHAEFEWDDTEAARQHRLQQARCLMNAIRVTFETPKKQDITISVMTAVSKPGGSSRSCDYTPLHFAMGDEDLRAEVLKTALRELAAFKRKYVELSELAQVIAVIDKTLRKAV